MPHADTLCQHILSIQWTYDVRRRASQVALFKEYMRRQALWLEALTLTDYFPTYDLAQLIDKDSRAATSQTNAIRSHLTQCSLNSTMIITGVLEAAIHWAALQDKGGIPSLPLPDPYAPLVLLYERGGTFTIEEMFGRFVVGYDQLGPSLPRGPWRRWAQRTPYTSLDNAALDLLDGL